MYLNVHLGGIYLLQLLVPHHAHNSFFPLIIQNLNSKQEMRTFDLVLYKSKGDKSTMQMNQNRLLEPAPQTAEFCPSFSAVI